MKARTKARKRTAPRSGSRRKPQTTRAGDIERWGVQDLVSVATGYAPPHDENAEPRGQFEVTIRHRKATPFILDEVRLTVWGPGLADKEPPLDIEVSIIGADLYAIRDLLAAAIAQAEQDAANTPKAPA